MCEERIVVCPYCRERAELVHSRVVSKDSRGMLRMCWQCTAYVGTHRNSLTHAPLGTLANHDLRQLRRKVHSVFDPLWKNKKIPKYKARGESYKWLAQRLGLRLKQCHIGMFTIRQCLAAIDVCKAWR